MPRENSIAPTSRQYPRALVLRKGRPEPLVCIYCKETGKKFSREHVIPQAFGKFGSRTLVIHCVCQECNTFFSHEFEQAISYGSLEAIQRWKQGLKPMETRSKIDSRRINLKARGGVVDGLRLDPVTMTREEILQFDLTRAHKLVIWNPEQREEFDTEFRRLGYMTEKNAEPSKVDMPAGTKLSGTMTVTIDIKTGRTMAKIAFNYLAYVCGADFALRPDFDIMRNYIRRGIKPPYDCMRVAGMEESARRGPLDKHVGHFLILHAHDKGAIIYARVALFSGHTYHFALSKYFSSLFIPEPLASGIGHRFDIATKRTELLSRKLLNFMNSPAYSY
jgi:hypothetical protein